MSFLEVVAHGATGTWLDEIVELGIPLVVLVILYFWSNRHPAKARATSDQGKGGSETGTANAGPGEREEETT